ncbi:MAG: type II toxin-antitoxin system VapC family toxin [Microbacteriaceae bacterium]|nr:type II toxin-antitoxin system VapC family toxin [Microbacteriaceae bacterium]MCL2794752.1 type II toxin-antitoxin system VapC family toxin [Microbacteriaceae bacterium]
MWAKRFPERLPREAAALLLDPRVEAYFSTVTLWELSIKFALGRAIDGLPNPRMLRPALLESGFDEIDLTAQHALGAMDPPHHHGDPFDRMLITQARLEGMVLLTADKALAAYGDPVRLVG